jgi:penicillin-binding protein 2
MWLGVLFGLVLFSFVVRLWALQVANWGDYTERGQKQRNTVVYGPALRGLIFDRNGTILADNQYIWNVQVTPKYLPQRKDELERETAILAGILGEISASELREHFEKMGTDRLQAEILPGGKDVPFEAVVAIEERKAELPGVTIAESARRHYSHGSLAAHVLGYVRGITEEQFARYHHLRYPDELFAEAGGATPHEGGKGMPIYGKESVVGQTGIERLCEIDTSTAPPVPILQGRRSRTVHEVDRRNNPVRVIEERPAAAGASVYLTIDTRVQMTAENSLKHQIHTTTGKTGAAICLDLQTGGILAMASYPTFDPNGWVRGWSPEEFKALNEDPRKPLFDKAIGGQYAPASTFKMVSATAALETTPVKLDTTYVCTGIIHEGTQHHPFKCWDIHGRVDFNKAIAESCDVYFYELVRKQGLSSNAIGYHARLFGFGDDPGLGLTGSASGLVPDAQYKLDKKDDRWRTGDTLNMVIGQGYLVATPLQVAVATAVVATDGDVIEPSLVRKIAWPSHMNREPTLYGRKLRRHLELKPKTLERVRHAMRLTVAQRKGTAHLLADLPFKCAGKTGSAEHDKRLKPHAWFTAFAPYDNPRFVVTVLISEGGYGSSTAGPVAKSILAAAMKAQDTSPADGMEGG